jgi:hypothetical protein
MNLLFLVLISLSGLWPTFPLAQAERWRGITPLHSTRADVERLVGPPTTSHGVAFTYETKEERILVFYSAGPCKNNVSEEWNVAPDPVLSITIHPNARLLIANLKLDESKYQKIPDKHAQSKVYYVNKS